MDPYWLVLFGSEAAWVIKVLVCREGQLTHLFFLGVLVGDMAQVGRSSSRRPKGPRGTGPGLGPARGRHRLGITRL